MMKTHILNEINEVLDKINDNAYKSIISYIQKARRVFLVGSGRSGLVGKCFAMRLMHLGIPTYVVGETTCPSINKNDLLIVISCSGSNVGILEFAKIAKNKNAYILSITSKDTPLVSVSHYSVEIPNIKTIQFGNSLFEQVAFLFLEIFVELYRKNKNIPFKEMITRHSDFT